MAAPTIIEDLTEEEKYLYCILSDESGLDLAEFTWVDEEQEDGCWRAWPFQWKWYRTTDPLQIDQCARSVGKSLSIKVRGFAFPFLHPGQEMVITAPELVHLEPIVSLIEQQFYRSRLGQYMLVRGRSAVTHRPFQMNFKNGSRIIGRIPQKDGKGVKGIHPIWLELDEAQDYPEPGWIELTETLKRGSSGAVWRAHGVTRGVRDHFFKFTADPNTKWRVHRFCLPGDTLVYTTHGPVEIADIQPGEEVWTITEEGKLSSDLVTAQISNGVQPIWEVKARGGFSLKSTYNHPFLVLARDGSRRTRRSLAFEWVEAQDIRAGDVIIGVHGLPQTVSQVPSEEAVTATLITKSPARVLPEWVWGSPRSVQLAFLHGYLLGDGSISRQKRGQNPWQVGTASEKLAKQLRALCHYMGLRTSALEMNEAVLTNGISTNPQWRFYIYADDSWFSQIPTGYSLNDLDLDEHFVARTVTSSEPTGESLETFDITVGEQHNFIAEGVVVHNTAMHRPTWTGEERDEKIDQYGGRDDPDYRRNVLGQHGDATSPIFVLHRLAACTDDDKESTYNCEEYTHRKINEAWLRETGSDILDELMLPLTHTDNYQTFWAGMDVGFTNHPSEILVFAEERMKKTEWEYYRKKKSVPPTPDIPRLKLITRITLTRIGSPDQKKAIMAIIGHYRPRVFAFDKTGNGLPMFQDIQNEVDGINAIKTIVKGYNFSGKIVVDLDRTIEVDEFIRKDDLIKDTGIKRDTVEYATDQMRKLVDEGRLWLPWDKDFLAELEGQTYKVTKTALNQYGKREFSLGKFHAFDAARMAVLGWANYAIEEFIAKDEDDPIIFRIG